jgi:hypothetical protein
MNDTLNRILRSGIQGAVAAAVLILGNEILTVDNITDVAWWKNLAGVAAVGFITAIISAIHNLVLDPSPIPSLAPAPTIEVPNDKDPAADGDDNEAGADGIPEDA